MLTTRSSQDFNFSVTDSTVYVNPGTALIGSNVVYFRGDNITFDKMVAFGDGTFQYSALHLQNINSYADLTSAVSASSDSSKNLYFPEISASNPYPVGLFLFEKSGESINLISSKRCV